MKTRYQLPTVLLLVLWMIAVCAAVNTEATASAASPALAQAAAAPKSGVGSQTAAQVCIGCHVNINRMLQARKKSIDEWRDTLYRMIGRGAQLFPEEIEPFAAYLAENAGRGRTPDTTVAGNQTAASDEAGAVLARRCQQCHDLERARTKAAAADWTTTIDRMIALGAAVTPGERQVLIEFLAGREK
jgi:cytochrome c2